MMTVLYRSDMKPPHGRGYKKDNKKRAYSEDDELDPMDPSSYSDAPRGGWYVTYSSSSHFGFYFSGSKCSSKWFLR